MHENKHIQWLLEQLPVLVQENILSPETADAVAARYRPLLSNRSQQNRISLALAVIGTVLIGGGIILLFAHNWSVFGRPLRTVLSFLPLIAAQGLTLHMWRHKRSSTPWRESTTLVQALMLASSMALIGQTYNLPSDAPSFTMTWLMLTLPMAFIIRSVSLHILLHAGLLTWFFQAPDSITRNLIFLVLAAVMTPFVIPLKSIPLPAAGHRMIRWSSAIVLLCIIPNLLISDVGSTILICFSLMLSSYCLIEAGPAFRERGLRDKPFATLGSAGIFIVMLLCTIPDIWTEFVLSREITNNIVVLFSLLAVNIGLLAINRKQRSAPVWIAGLTGPLTFIAALPAGNGFFQFVFYWGFCAWLTALGIACLTAGFKEKRLSRVNLGMAILLIHIVIQFMRADIGYLVRSLVFIGMGILFLVVNRRLSTRWRSSR